MDFWRITKWAQMDPQTPTGRHWGDVTSVKQRRTHSFTQWTNSDPPPPTAQGGLGHDNSRSRVPFYFPTRAKRRRPHESHPVIMATKINSQTSPPSTTSPPPDSPSAPTAREPDAPAEHTDSARSPTSSEDTEMQEPETYPSPPTSDGRDTAGDTSPATTTDNRDQTTTNMIPPEKDFYPASAYGPQGPEGYRAGSQATQDTMAMAASGQFNEASGSPGVQTDDSASKRGPPQFFSEPPMPVYHTQPQTTASYYPGASIALIYVSRHLLTCDL
jgi:hypothetical protein